jgi:hypothetical protein
MNPQSLLLVFLLCMVVVPSTIVSGSEYMGEGIQLGGSGTMITRITTVPVTAPATASLAIIAAGSLSVTTTPAGATVFIDGVQRGLSPVTIPDLSPGTHALRVVMNGYTGFTTPVTITSGQTQTYTTALSPAAVAANTPSQTASKKTPGFETVITLFAVGMIMTLKKLL